MQKIWYVKQDGERVGPLSHDELRQMVDYGELLPDDPVWREGEREWIPASEIRGLFRTNAAPGQASSGAVVVATMSLAAGVLSFCCGPLCLIAIVLGIVAFTMPVEDNQVVTVRGFAGVGIAIGTVWILLNIAMVAFVLMNDPNFWNQFQLLGCLVCQL